MSENTVPVTDETFKTDVLDASGLVLVDFWAEWCGPCRMIAPALEEIGKENKGRLTVAKVNIDENPMTPTTYGVQGIPTLIMYKGCGLRPVVGVAVRGVASKGGGGAVPAVASCRGA